METDKGLNDFRKKLEQEIPEFATDDTRELLETLSAAREVLRNKSYELVLESGRQRGAPASGSTRVDSITQRHGLGEDANFWIPVLLHHDTGHRSALDGN